MAFFGVQNFPQVFPKNYLGNMYHVAILCVLLIMACVYAIHLPKFNTSCKCEQIFHLIGWWVLDMRLRTDLPYWQLSFKSLRLYDLTILVLKYVQNFTKIYKTLAGALTNPCTLYTHYTFPPPAPTPPGKKPIEL